jgi:hypothetical protein
LPPVSTVVVALLCDHFILDLNGTTPRDPKELKSWFLIHELSINTPPTTIKSSKSMKVIKMLAGHGLYSWLRLPRCLTLAYACSISLVQFLV